MLEHVRREDAHSSLILNNRGGMRLGAKAKYKAGVVDAKTRDDILGIVDKAKFGDFRPLLFVIPYKRVSRLITQVPPALRAHPLSEELLLPLLPRKLFDVIELGVPT